VVTLGWILNEPKIVEFVEKMVRYESIFVNLCLQRCADISVICEGFYDLGVVLTGFFQLDSISCKCGTGFTFVFVL